MAKLEGGGYLFGGCKWSKNAPVSMEVYARLLAKVERLPEAHYKKAPTYVLFSLVLFSLGSFTLSDRKRYRHLGFPSPFRRLNNV